MRVASKPEQIGHTKGTVILSSVPNHWGHRAKSPAASPQSTPEKQRHVLPKATLTSQNPSRVGIDLQGLPLYTMPHSCRTRPTWRRRDFNSCVIDS